LIAFIISAQAAVCQVHFREGREEEKQAWVEYTEELDYFPIHFSGCSKDKRITIQQTGYVGK
jgi:hypothetical protein